MQEYAGTFRDSQGQLGACLFMQGIQGNTEEYRVKQSKTGEYRRIKGNLIKLSGQYVY